MRKIFSKPYLFIPYLFTLPLGVGSIKIGVDMYYNNLIKWGDESIVNIVIGALFFVMFQLVGAMINCLQLDYYEKNN